MFDSQMAQSDCTIYLAKDGENEFIRIPVAGVHWEDLRGKRFSMNGQSSADSITVYIPLEKADLSGWKDGSNGYILKGVIGDEIDATDVNSHRAFLRENDALKITAISKFDFSIAIGDHWQVYAK